MTQNGISTFNNGVNLLEYTKNPDTETAEIIIPILNINTLKPGNKIVLYNKGYDVTSNPYICGIGIKQDSSSTTGITDYNDTYNRIVSTNFKSPPFSLLELLFCTTIDASDELSVNGDDL